MYQFVEDPLSEHELYQLDCQFEKIELVDNHYNDFIDKIYSQNI